MFGQFGVSIKIMFFHKGDRIILSQVAVQKGYGVILRQACAVHSPRERKNISLPPRYESDFPLEETKIFDTAYLQFITLVALVSVWFASVDSEHEEDCFELFNQDCAFGMVRQFQRFAAMSFVGIEVR